MNFLLDMNKEGKTVIIVTHDAYVAQQCHRVIELWKNTEILSKSLNLKIPLKFNLNTHLSIFLMDKIEKRLF